MTQTIPENSEVHNFLNRIYKHLNNKKILKPQSVAYSELHNPNEGPNLVILLKDQFEKMMTNCTVLDKLN